MFIINFCLNMFRASLCQSSGEQDVCYCTWCAALVLLDVVGSGCGALRCGVRALWRLARTPQRSAPQPLPTTSSRTSEHCEGYSNLQSARTPQRSAPQPLPTTSSRTSEHCEGYSNLHSARIPQRSAPQPLPTTSSRTSAAHHMQQHTSCSPEDGHNDARNMLRQKLIINIWLLRLVGFLSLSLSLSLHDCEQINIY